MRAKGRHFYRRHRRLCAEASTNESAAGSLTPQRARPGSHWPPVPNKNKGIQFDAGSSGTISRRKNEKKI